MRTTADFLKLTGLTISGAVTLQISLAQPARAFNDTSNYWANRCIDRLGTLSLIRGYPDGSFRPNATVTRAEFAILMLNTFPNAPKVQTVPEFRDVPANFWAARAIRGAAERGFFSGYPDGTFKPQQAISRVQAIAVLANAQQLPIFAVPEPILKRYFTDAGQIPLYAGGAISSAAQNEKIVNYPNVRQLRPNQNITRGEVAALLCQARNLKLVPQQYVASEINLVRGVFAFGPEIDAFGPFSQGLVTAKWDNNKIGYIDSQGKTVIPAKFDFAQAFAEDRAVAGIVEGDRTRLGYIDLQGNWVVRPQYVIAQSFSEGLAAVSLDGQKYGFIDRAGKIIVTPQYDLVLPFSEGLAAVSQGDRWGFIDKTGKIAIPLQYPSVSPFSEGMARISTGEQVGFIDTAGNPVIAPQFSAAWDFSEGFAPALDRATKRWGYIDRTGNWAISPQFDAVQPFSEGLAGVGLGGKWGFIDKTGKVAIPAQYFSPQTQFDGGGSNPYSDPMGVLPFKNGLALARNGKSVGFIDRQGRWFIEPLLYNDAEPISEGLAWVHVGGEWVPEYDYPNNSPYLRNVMVRGGGWGYIRVNSPSN